MRRRFWLMTLFTLIGVGCSGSKLKATDCGTGTKLDTKTGKCVLDTGATTGGAGTGSVTCGAGTVLSNGACVVDASGCAAGTVLNTANVCEPAAAVCAAGSTFDVSTKQCVANISACGPKTHPVGGVCVPFVRVTVMANHVSATTAVDWYAITIADLFAGELGDTERLANGVKLGTTAGPFAASGLTEVNLSIVESYVLILVPTGQPLAVSTPGLIPLMQTVSLPLNFPSLDVSSPPPSVLTFTPVAGDQIISLAPMSPSIGMHVPFPDGEATSSQALVSVVMFTDVDSGATVGFVPSSNHLEDPFGFDTFVGTLARTHGRLVSADDVITLHKLSGIASGSLLGAFEVSASAPDLELVPGERYVCVVFGSPPAAGDLVCYDGLAHAAAIDVPATWPSTYKRLTFLDPAGLTYVTRRGINTFPSDVQLNQTGVSTNTKLFYGNGTLSSLEQLTTVMHSGAHLEFDLADSTDVVVNTATVDVPTTNGNSSFMVIAPKAGDAAKPALTLVPERAAILPVGRTSYTLVNARAVSADFSLAITSISTDHTLPAGEFSTIDIDVDCSLAVTHYVNVDSACLSFDPCAPGPAPHASGLGFEGQHVLLVVPASGNLQILELDGTLHDLGALGPC